MEVSATGSGVAIVQVTHRYHVDVTGPDPSFFLDPKMDGLSNKRHIKVSACTGSVPEGGRNILKCVVYYPHWVIAVG